MTVPLLHLEQLTRSYTGLTALNQLTLTLDQGTRHAVIGANGAGKTTLLNLIAGTITPTTGRIRLDGRDITNTGPATRARLGIARTFQTPAIYPTLSALDNVILGAWTIPPPGRRGAWRPSRYRALATRCLHLLDTLGLADLAHRPAGTLSHGQKRLLEIATTLAARPKLLLLDEPAAGLTTTDLDRLVTCLHALPPEVTVLLVEHHLDLVTTIADTLTVLHHGNLLATGDPHQVITDPAVTDTYLTTTTTTTTRTGDPQEDAHAVR